MDANQLTTKTNMQTPDVTYEFDFKDPRLAWSPCGLTIQEGRARGGVVISDLSDDKVFMFCRDFLCGRLNEKPFQYLEHDYVHISAAKEMISILQSFLDDYTKFIEEGEDYQ